jgi:hypothetical protein
MLGVQKFAPMGSIAGFLDEYEDKTYPAKKTVT